MTNKKNEKNLTSSSKKSQQTKTRTDKTQSYRAGQSGSHQSSTQNKNQSGKTHLNSSLDQESSFQGVRQSQQQTKPSSRQQNQSQKNPDFSSRIIDEDDEVLKPTGDFGRTRQQQAPSKGKQNSSSPKKH